MTMNFLLDYKFENKRGQANEICSLLEDFQGYNANGFFNVNHSLISGVTANFVTYLIILVQFRLSEKWQGNYRNKLLPCSEYQQASTG